MTKKKPTLGKMSSARTKKAKVKKAVAARGKLALERWMRDKGGL